MDFSAYNSHVLESWSLDTTIAGRIEASKFGICIDLHGDKIAERLAT